MDSCIERANDVLKNVTIKAMDVATGEVVAEGRTGQGSYGLDDTWSDRTYAVTLQAFVRGVRVFESPPMPMRADEQTYRAVQGCIVEYILNGYGLFIDVQR